MSWPFHTHTSKCYNKDCYKKTLSGKRYCPECEIIANKELEEYFAYEHKLQETTKKICLRLVELPIEDWYIETEKILKNVYPQRKQET